MNTAETARIITPVEGGATGVRDPEERGPIGLHPPLRRATKRDARALAGLIEYAGHGILGYP